MSPLRLALLQIPLALGVIATGCDQRNRTVGTLVNLEVWNRTGNECRKVVLSDFAQLGERGYRELGTVPPAEKVDLHGFQLGTQPDPPVSASVSWETDRGSFSQVISFQRLPETELNGAYYVIVLLPEGSADGAASKERNSAEARRVACGGGPEYWVMVANHTEEKIVAVNLYFGDYQVIADATISGRDRRLTIPESWRGVDALPCSIPDTAVLEWRTPHGKLHRRSVPLRDTVTENMNGKELWFVISEDSVVDVNVVEHAKSVASSLSGIHPLRAN